MSQSAENQSAIIENENNSNIVMESQAAMTVALSSGTVCVSADSPHAAVQGKTQETMITEEARCPGDDGIAVNGSDHVLLTGNGDAGQQLRVDASAESVAVGASGDVDLLEPQDTHRSQSPAPAQSEKCFQQEEADETMDVAECKETGLASEEPVDGETEASKTGQNENEHIQTDTTEAIDNHDMLRDESTEGVDNRDVLRDESAGVVDAGSSETADCRLENQTGLVPENDDTVPDQEENSEQDNGTVVQYETTDNRDDDVSMSADDVLLAEDVGNVSASRDAQLESQNSHQLQWSAQTEKPFEQEEFAEAIDVADPECKETDLASEELVNDETEASEASHYEHIQTNTTEADSCDILRDESAGVAAVQTETDNHDVSMSADDEDALLAEDHVESQEPTQDDCEDTSQGIEVQSKVLDVNPEVNEDQSMLVESISEITGDQQRASVERTERSEDNAAEVVESVTHSPETVPYSPQQTNAEGEEIEMVESAAHDGQEPAVQSTDCASVESTDAEKTGEEAETSQAEFEDAESTENNVSAKSADAKKTGNAENTENGTREIAVEGFDNVNQKPDDSCELEENNSSQTVDSDKTSDLASVKETNSEGEPMLEVTEIKSEAGLVETCDIDLTGDDTPEMVTTAHEDMDAETTEQNDEGSKAESTDKDIADLAADITGKIKSEGVMDVHAVRGAVLEDDDDDDVVVLDDDEVIPPKVKNEAVEKDLFNSSNDMGIQIESVSGGADELHKLAEQNLVKQENGLDQKPPTTSLKKELQTGNNTPAKKAPAKTQACIVCKRVGKCKYNIVRHGDIKHLCDDYCFKRFRAKPTLYLKGSDPGTAASTTPAASKSPAASTTPAANKGSKAASATLSAGKSSVPGYKTCVVCLLMNISSQGQFCMWKGMDFCGEGCLGKFQAGISSNCTLCTAFIPLTARSINCLRLGNEVRPFCSSGCYSDYTKMMRLCVTCHKDVSVSIGSFSSPVGADKLFKDFCSQHCFKKYEDLLNTDVEIIRVEQGKSKVISKCNVCQKSQVSKHTIKYNGVIHNLCSDPCLSAFRYANKLDVNTCDFCKSVCTLLESSVHTVQLEGSQKRFCSDKCVTQYRQNHRKIIPCSWCGAVRENFDMIERLDANNKYQLFCTLNCLSLYRVNLQAKSNQAVSCDQCTKLTPAQYHLTMSDASVRNFCSYNCVMSFQAQFSKGTPTSAQTPAIPMPKHKHNTRGKANIRSTQQTATAASPSVPVISNVISLAPQGVPKGNSKSNTGAPVVVSGFSPAVKTTSTGSGPVQQKIIIQPPPPKVVKNKALLCKPFVQTKATSCRPHTQSKECQTDKVKEQPVLIPVPVPVYLPTPMALYSAPTPTPVFIPVPIPVPIFIPTTRKSANGIMKHIKEIQEKTPSDPLEAELLRMAEAVSGDKRDNDDSDTEDEMLPDISRPQRRPVPMDDNDDDADVMPLTSDKAEDGGEEDMISMALRMAEEMSGPIADLESAVEAVPVNTERPPPSATVSPDTYVQEEEYTRTRRGAKRGSTTRRSVGRPPKRARTQPAPAPPQADQIINEQPAEPPAPPADASYHLKFTYGVNAWRHWVMLKNTQIERNMKPGSGRVKKFKTDILQCTADELNFCLCLFVKEVRKPNGDEYSPDSIYYLTLGIQQYLYENGRIDNLYSDLYYDKFTDCLREILAMCQPKFNSSGQMVCRIEEEHLWECKQLGAHSPYVLLNTLIYFHTKYFMLKTPEDHMKLSFAHILKYWKKGQPSKAGQPTRSVSLRYYSVSNAKKDGSATTSLTKKGSKEGIPVYEVTENQENPLRCPVKLYEFYLSKCPESIKNRSDIFYPVPERSCVPDSPVWYSTMPIGEDVMAKMLTRTLLVREIQEAHLHAQPIFV